MRVDPAVERLLIRAGILSTYHQRTWFAGCTLKGPLLSVPDALQARVITVSYLADLRLVLSDLELRVSAAALNSLANTSKTAYRGASSEAVQPRLED